MFNSSQQQQSQPLAAAWKVALSVVFGGAILYWMYRDFDFARVEHVLLHEMNWMWMLLSFPFGFLAQAIRGWRWRQALEPVGERPRRGTLVDAVMLSYAASLVVPRVGEFARCGVLRRWEGVSFAKALGTVVTERAIDSLLVMVIAGLTVLMQVPVFGRFFSTTGTKFDLMGQQFTTAGWLVTAACVLLIVLLGVWMARRLAIYNKVKSTLTGLWEGVMSVRQVANKPLFAFYSLAIWGCYFLHYYLTFFCFTATEGLGMMCALVTFIVGSIAVIVPTPNGAGPWHFAVKTMLILYGVPSDDALSFVLIVHSVQTLLVVLLGMWAWASLMRRQPAKTEAEA